MADATPNDDSCYLVVSVQLRHSLDPGNAAIWLSSCDDPVYCMMHKQPTYRLRSAVVWGSDNRTYPKLVSLHRTLAEGLPFSEPSLNTAAEQFDSAIKEIIRSRKCEEGAFTDESQFHRDALIHALVQELWTYIQSIKDEKVGPDREEMAYPFRISVFESSEDMGAHLANVKLGGGFLNLSHIPSSFDLATSATDVLCIQCSGFEQAQGRPFRSHVIRSDLIRFSKRGNGKLALTWIRFPPHSEYLGRPPPASIEVTFFQRSPSGNGQPYLKGHDATLATFVTNLSKTRRWGGHNMDELQWRDVSGDLHDRSEVSTATSHVKGIWDADALPDDFYARGLLIPASEGEVARLIHIASQMGVAFASSADVSPVSLYEEEMDERATPLARNEWPSG